MGRDEASPGASRTRKKSNWWGETERVMLPVAIFPKMMVGLTAARVFGALALRADNKSGLVDSTFEQMAEDAAMSRGQVAEGVRALIELGWVEQVRKGNSRVSSKYRLRSEPSVLNSPDLRTLKGPEIRTVNRPKNQTVQKLDRPETRTPSSSPTTKEQKTSLSAEAVSTKPTRTKNAYTAEFETAWRAYPRRSNGKGSKFDAFREWNKAVKLDGVTAERLTAAIRIYAGTIGDFPKDAERWLKGRMWEDLDDAPTVNGHLLSFESFVASADAKAAASLIRVPYADPSQHPNDPTPRAHWIRARRLEWIEQHETQIRAALTAKAS